MNTSNSTIIRQTKRSRNAEKNQTKIPPAQSWSERMAPSAHLSKGAKAVWESAIDSVSPDRLSELDRAALEAWANACDLYRQAQVGLSATGLVVRAPVTGTLVQSPYLAILNKQVSIIIRTSTQLGFTPASRARVTPKPTEQNLSNIWNDFPI